MSATHSRQLFRALQKHALPDLTRVLAASLFSTANTNAPMVDFLACRPAKPQTTWGRSRTLRPGLHRPHSFFTLSRALRSQQSGFHWVECGLRWLKGIPVTRMWRRPRSILSSKGYGITSRTPFDEGFETLPRVRVVVADCGEHDIVCKAQRNSDYLPGSGDGAALR